MRVSSTVSMGFAIKFCLKVGGIYTVLRSKAPISTEELGDQYCALGPLREERWRLEVEQIEPESRNIRAALRKLNEGGFKVRNFKSDLAVEIKIISCLSFQIVLALSLFFFKSIKCFKKVKKEDF